jgi:very-short-patch-repair endonuclease
MKQNLTPNEKLLFDALVKRGVEVIPLYKDEYAPGKFKTVDMAVKSAKLYIEVDGLQHFTDSGQIMRDFKRSHFSDGDDFSTFYVTNQIIEHYVDKVADALVEVVKERISN